METSQRTAALNGAQIQEHAERNRLLVSLVAEILSHGEALTIGEILRELESRGHGDLLPQDGPITTRQTHMWRIIMRIEGLVTVETIEAITVRKPIKRYCMAQEARHRHA